MAIRANVTVTGQQAIGFQILGMAQRLIGEFDHYVTSEAPRWNALLKATVAHVVYVGAPKQYRRNRNLEKAATVEIRPMRFGAAAEAFNDDSKVTLKGGGISAGGSRKQDVPVEVEFGDYPQPWYGIDAPRPAYLIFADLIRPRIYADADAIIQRVTA